MALRQLVEHVCRLVNPAALTARLGPHFLDRLPEAQRGVGNRELGPDREPPSLQIEQQLLPGSRALAQAVDEADELLRAFRRRADDDEQALRIVLEPGLHVDAVGPEVDVALRREIPLQPARVFVRPGVLEPGDARGRKAARLLAEQGGQRLLEVAGGHALEVEGGDQNLQALRAAGVTRQDGRAGTQALLAGADAVANTWCAHRDRANAGHDLTLWQVTMAHQPPASRLGELVGMALHECRHLRLHRLRQQRTSTAAQDLAQRIGKRPWLRQLENVTFRHGVSLLQWRSGGFSTPTIRRLTLSRRHQLPRIPLGGGWRSTCRRTSSRRRWP